MELPNKKYKIIYADPPWKYSLWKKNVGRGLAENYYETMDLFDIATLPIQSIADQNCILFLWATYPNLPMALKLIRIWGFEYKTVAFTWIKKNKKVDSLFWGMGSWTRANAEFCLLATKGYPKRKSKAVHSIVISKIREHSRKPEEVRERIVELMGDIPRIELFARQKTKGWDSWGDEVANEKQLNQLS